eukprot:COSAG01_NODE_8164_length_2894_cov_63.589624_1_plen_21_part_10
MSFGFRVLDLHDSSFTNIVFS